MTDPLQIARDLVPLVEQEASTSEHLATMPDPVVQAFRDSGLFALQIPRSLGGFEADIETTLGVYETVCRADASTGWSLLANASTSAFATTYTGDAAVAAMFADGTPVHAGQFAPRGSAIAVSDDAYQVAGSYSFGSGSAHANWIGGGTLELVEGVPRMVTPERPAIRVFFVPRDQVQFVGNWDVMGLVGTGSFDYVVPEQVVDAAFTFDMMNDQPQRGGPMYRIGVLGLAAIGHAGFALGVGRRALDEIAVLAQEKQRLGQASVLADQERFQYDLGKHDAAMRAARALVFDAFGTAQEQLDAGDDFDMDELLPLRQATTWATDVAEEAVRFAYLASGSDGLRNPSVIGRCFRDIHAASQHVVVDDSTIVQAGRALLGALMPDLCELVAPGHTAIITQECQRGVIGAESALPQLAESARTSGTIDNVARLVGAGRRAGVEIIHHIAMHRSDMKGANQNGRVFRAMARRGGPQLVGSEMVDVADPITVSDSDIISTRLHGLGPIAGTDVDSILRNLGTTTVVIVGVSSNVAIPNAVFDAVNLAYEVVVPRDAIAGVPPEYTDTIVDNSLSLVATITTTDELVACWEDAG